MAKQEIGPNPIDNPAAPQSPVPPPATAVYGKDGRLTYESLRGITAAGGSVVLGGKVITTANLPSELDYANAGGDATAKANAQNALQAEIDRLQGELARAKAAPQRAGESEPAEETTYGDGKHRLEFFDGKDDESILKLKGIGPGTLAEIRAAQAKAGRKQQ